MLLGIINTVMVMTADDRMELCGHFLVIVLLVICAKLLAQLLRGRKDREIGIIGTIFFLLVCLEIGFICWHFLK